MINLPPRYSNVISVFSQGGMADTLLCRDSHLDRDVVIKSLKAGIEPRRLLDELAALSAIRSRYVVQVLDVIVEAGRPVGFVEEYLSGNSVAPCGAAATATEALKAIYPIAAGIAEIHAHQRVHRDIKPDNMRYDADGQLKIFDFGLAKLSAANGTSVLYYSDGFTAPEAFQKNSNGLHTFDYPVDVYSFGCLAVWLLNGGNIPAQFSGLNPSLPPGFSFANLLVSVPPEVTNLLNKCLDPNPASRPSIFECRDVIKAELLRDKHRMLLTSTNSIHVLDSSKRNATISAPGCSITVGYDGLGFSVNSASGTVLINNGQAYIGQILTGSTVIVLVNDANGRKVSITCDVSHPEVTL